MKVTEVRLRLVSERNERLKAFCTMTLDNEFVVRDIKIIEGAKGLFVAMPSRKLADHCPKCGAKNPVQSNYCADCGQRLSGPQVEEGSNLGDKLHTDIAHPINAQCRSKIEEAILKAYEEEVARSHRGESSPARAADEDEPYNRGGDPE